VDVRKKGNHVSRNVRAGRPSSTGQGAKGRSPSPDQPYQATQVGWRNDNGVVWSAANVLVALGTHAGSFAVMVQAAGCV
jgi:hypothetical protein